MWGNSNFDRRHVFNFYYIYDLPFFKQQTNVMSRILGGWQITGATFMRTGTPLWVTQGADIAGIGDTNAQPWNQVSDPVERRQRRVLGGRGRPELLVQSDGVRASGQRHVRQRAAQSTSTTLASTSGTSRSSRT